MATLLTFSRHYYPLPAHGMTTLSKTKAGKLRLVWHHRNYHDVMTLSVVCCCHVAIRLGLVVLLIKNKLKCCAHFFWLHLHMAAMSIKGVEPATIWCHNISTARVQKPKLVRRNNYDSKVFSILWCLTVYFLSFNESGPLHNTIRNTKKEKKKVIPCQHSFKWLNCLLHLAEQR